MKNVEIKLRPEHVDSVRDRCAKLVGAPTSLLHQVDTYFHVQYGRCKMREINDDIYELISYERADQALSRTSTYHVSRFGRDTALELKDQLRMCLGVLVVVTKDRTLYRYKHTRIHFDNVTDLGAFVELESVVDGISVNEARKELEETLHMLGLEEATPCSGSYSDMILAARA